MRDPHVAHLLYTVSSEPTTRYLDPPALAHENALGIFHLANGQLRLTPSEHFANSHEAVAAIAPYLKAWEVATDLAINPGTIRFQFHSADVVDRDPPPGLQDAMLFAEGTVVSVSGGTATLCVGRSTYPEPPHSFRLTPEADIAVRRWRAFRAGAEPLPSMAYFVLTLLERQAGLRPLAAKVFSIQGTILDKIGELSSERGDAESARKASRLGVFRPLASGEAAWLEAAVRQLILRLGEHASGWPLTPITAATLPLP
jgi:hypothetical protein